MKAKNLFINLGIAIAILLMLSLGIKTTSTMPENAIIVVNDSTNIYAPPHCYKETGRKAPINIRLARFEEIKGKGYEPDPICRDQGYFIGETVSLLWDFLESNQILKSKKPRWKKGGEWNW